MTFAYIAYAIEWIMKDSWKLADNRGNIIGKVRVNEPRRYFLSPNDEADVTIAAEPELAYGQVKPMIQYLGYSQQEIAAILEVDPSTLFRWGKDDKTIGKLRSKTMYDIDKIISKGVTIFGSEAQLKEWLHTVNYALGDKRPIDLLKDPYGIDLVDDAMEAMAWGNVL